MTTELMNRIDTTDIDRKTKTALDQAEAIKICTNADYTAATAFLRLIKSARVEIDETFNPSIESAHETHKRLLSAKKIHSGPLDRAELIVKGKVSTYMIEQEKIRQEAERKAQADAQKKAEDERLAAALEADKAGKKAKAEALIQAPVIAAPVIIPKSTPVVDGISSRKVWKFRIVNGGKNMPFEYLMPDEIKIGAVVRALKDACNIPDVEVYCEESVSVRRS